MTDPRRELAEQVRRACLEAALAAWEDARMAGLCAEGAFEAAIGAVRAADLSRVADAAQTERMKLPSD